MIRVGRARRDRGILVARPSRLGHPFKIGVDGDRETCIARYREWLPGQIASDARIRAELDRIEAAARSGDVTLLCYCAPQLCHGDVIADVIRERLTANP